MSEFEVATLPEVNQAWGKLNSVTRKTVPHNYRIASDDFTIGRNPEINDLVINDPRLSGGHARISVTWNNPVRTEIGRLVSSTKRMVVTITDLSTNGTYLNK
jgi:pSer/pThr/pTyr-binding forkhead associated (FHA) protein